MADTCVGFNMSIQVQFTGSEMFTSLDGKLQSRIRNDFLSLVFHVTSNDWHRYS